MAGYTGNVTNANGTNAHENMLAQIETMLLAQGWTTLRKGNISGTATPAGRRLEVIMKGVGLSGLEEIYIGFMCYQDPDNDYYNMTTAGFTGYDPANAFFSQPGLSYFSVCAHNQRIDYWAHVNGQGIVFGLKVGTPVYELGIAQKIFPGAPPSQYSYPLLIGGSMDGQPATRYSDKSRSIPLFPPTDGAHWRLRLNNGTWTAASTNVMQSNILGKRDSLGKYTLAPIQMTDGAEEGMTPQANLYGWVDGVYWLTGFNITTESTITIGSNTFIVLQNIYRVGLGDYFALDITP